MLVLLLLLAPVRAEPPGALDTRVVETGAGNVRGYSRQVLGHKVYRFLGIPYARPPTGRARFR